MQLLSNHRNVVAFLVEDIVYSPNKYRETEGIKVNHANAILLLGMKDDNIYILQEIYVFEKETAEIIPLAIKAGIPTNRIMWCDSAEPDRIKTWKTAGFMAKAVSKEQTVEKKYQAAQIDWLKGIVSKDKVFHRIIYVHPSCVNTIKELQQWKWKKDEKTGMYLDEPVPFQDDAMAALRYGVESWRKPIGKIKIKTFKGGI